MPYHQISAEFTPDQPIKLYTIDDEDFKENLLNFDMALFGLHERIHSALDVKPDAVLNWREGQSDLRPYYAVHGVEHVILTKDGLWVRKTVDRPWHIVDFGIKELICERLKWADGVVLNQEVDGKALTDVFFSDLAELGYLTRGAGLGHQMNSLFWQTT